MAAKKPVQPASRSANPTENSVERTRAWTSLWVVVGGDVAIAAAAILALWKTAGSGTTNTSEIAILTSAFTAISTMTTAYFGIKTQAHTAQSFAPAVHSAIAGVMGKAAADDNGDDDGTDDPTASGPPIPVDPSNPTAAEIVARMAEPND